MKITQRVITDPREVQKKMIELNKELKNFELYIRMNKKKGMYNIFRTHEERAIIDVMNMVRREILRIQQMLERQAVDGLVTESLEKAGFKPD